MPILPNKAYPTDATAWMVDTGPLTVYSLNAKLATVLAEAQRHGSCSGTATAATQPP